MITSFTVDLMISKSSSFLTAIFPLKLMLRFGVVFCGIGEILPFTAGVKYSEWISFTL